MMCSVYTGGRGSAPFTETAYRVKYFKPIPKEINQDVSTILDVGLFFISRFLYTSVFRVTRLRIDPNNVTTYYYKNTTKG